MRILGSLGFPTQHGRRDQKRVLDAVLKLGEGQRVGRRGSALDFGGAPQFQVGARHRLDLLGLLD